MATFTSQKTALTTRQMPGAAVRKPQRFWAAASAQAPTACKTALVGASAAAFLLAGPAAIAGPAIHFQNQEVAQIAAVNVENNMKIDPKSSTDPLGTPGSQSRYPEGQPLSGDEAKVREARRLLQAEEQSDAASKPGQEYTKTNTFLDPYGRKESAKPEKAGKLF